ncbi:hypothetical protein H6G33_07860 [Calothrix sp. FACHB-1219]|uniref:hypothetical protein n=1 Tax=unclassified Calothrix TaxID=2619626 RepID=UPI0016896093|nr:MULTISPECIES: hypothetical protein [unclassified Calothrix]MBD2201908.1 hypothetical protein [Calothrix sp. FACHB-168]MBD2216943.1 hypothetical protein [Calothrix sp. FACHB-1219]
MIRRSASIALTTLMALPVAGLINQLSINPAMAQTSRCNLNVQPGQSAYSRGTNIAVRFHVTQNGHPVANTPVLVQETYYHEFRKRTEQRILTQTQTNHEGGFTLRYEVPREVFKDKVSLLFVNPVAGGCSRSFVIPIG